MFYGDRNGRVGIGHGDLVEGCAVVAAHTFSEKILRCLKAPGGTNEDVLELSENGVRCVTTGEEFPSIDGIPSLYKPAAWGNSEITRRVKSFYEENPFPSYEGVEEFGE